MVVQLELVDGLHYETYEAGPLTEIYYPFLDRIPFSENTAYFSLDFLARRGIIPDTNATMTVNTQERRLELEEGPYGMSNIVNLLNGGRIEKLQLRYPPLNRKEGEYFDKGEEAFRILRDNFELLEENSYNPDISSLRVMHYIVKAYGGGFAPSMFSSFTGKVHLKTQELVKGKPERKLVLSFTHDLESSPEVVAYKELLDSVNHAV